MRKSVFVFSVALAALVSAAAWAGPNPNPPNPNTKQQPQQQPSNAAPRYFDLTNLFGENDDSDAFLKETRQGNRVTSAVLDVCYTATATSGRRDRFELTLKVEGNKLTANGQSQIDKTPISVQLTRRGARDSFNFAGNIKIGSNDSEVSLEELEDMSEADFREQQPEAVEIQAAPADFSDTSPGLVGIRVRREQLGALVKSLKGENVKLSLDGLLPDCLALRTGQQTLLVNVEPERAAALINKVKSAPGVSLAGYSKGIFDYDNAMRLPARAWQTGGKLDRDKLAAAIATSSAKALGATTESTNFDRRTGELTLKLKRANKTLPELNLTDAIELTILFGPEKLSGNDATIVWVGNTQITTTDQGPEPRFEFWPVAGGDDSIVPDSVDVSALLEAVARDLKGKLWDSDDEVWNDP